MPFDPAEHRLDELLAAARRGTPRLERAELGFETRLLATLRGQREASVGLWAWRLAPLFAVFALTALWWSGVLARESWLPSSSYLVEAALNGGGSDLTTLTAEDLLP